VISRFAWIVTALVGLVGFLLGLVAVRTGAPPVSKIDPATVSVPVTPLVVQSGAEMAVSAAGPDFAEVVARLNGTVVNVDSAVRGDQPPDGQRFRRDVTDPNAPHEGTGSGFIIDATGYILTNFHVVDGADRLTVTLGDGRAFRASVIGADPALDVALIKIAAPGGLPVALLGDSAGLRVGQWVCAIGNPLGYVHSVTVGVVSFLGRKLFDQTLDAYIQTDAAISLGNSGGPLIDSAGRVVGITTAVSSQSSSIGFAIPISQVLDVLPQLKERGRVSRGSVGIGVTRMTPSLKLALGLPVDFGALVQDVTADTPADRAGIRRYDIIVAADGVPIRSDDDFIRHVTSRAPGTATALDVAREETRERIIVKLTERPVPLSAQGRARRSDARPAMHREQGPLGLTVRDIDTASALRKVLPEGVRGVVVVEVDPAGPARQARVRAGQVVLEVNRRLTPSIADFDSAVAAVPNNVAAVMLVYDPLTDQRQLMTIIPDRQP
jgi:serine protease Do